MLIFVASPRRSKTEWLEDHFGIILFITHHHLYEATWATSSVLIGPNINLFICACENRNKMEWNQMCVHTHISRIRESSAHAAHGDGERERGRTSENDVCIEEQIHIIPLGFFYFLKLARFSGAILLSHSHTTYIFHPSIFKLKRIFWCFGLTTAFKHISHITSCSDVQCCALNV